jgi:hypothetical protein
LGGAAEDNLSEGGAHAPAAKGALPAERIDEVIRAATGSLGVPMTSAEQQLLRDVVNEIQRLGRKVDEIDNEAASCVEADRAMQLMSEVVGPAAVVALLAYLGAPSQFASASAYEKASGLNLKVRSSGKHEGRLKITKHPAAVVPQPGGCQVRRVQKARGGTAAHQTGNRLLRFYPWDAA